jgi:hypothetical protein
LDRLAAGEVSLGPAHVSALEQICQAPQPVSRAVLRAIGQRLDTNWIIEAIQEIFLRQTMPQRLTLCLAIAAVLTLAAVGTHARESPQAGANAPYQAVTVCSLVPFAEVKKLVAWAPQLETRPEEEPTEVPGSSCSYTGLGVQVVQFNRRIIETARRSLTLEAVAGVGDEAYVTDNGGRFANLYAKVGPHLLTMQLAMGGKPFASTRAKLIEIGKAFAATLR